MSTTYWMNKRLRKRERGKYRKYPMIWLLIHVMKTPEGCSKKEWKETLRKDPCAYCGKPRSGTVDHIVPRSALEIEPEWDGFTGACKECNQAKEDKPWHVFFYQLNIVGT